MRSIYKIIPIRLKNIFLENIFRPTVGNSKDKNRRNSDNPRNLSRGKNFPSNTEIYQNGKIIFEEESTNDTKRDATSMRIGSLRDAYPSHIPNQKLQTPTMNGNYQNNYKQPPEHLYLFKFHILNTDLSKIF